MQRSMISTKLDDLNNTINQLQAQRDRYLRLSERLEDEDLALLDDNIGIYVFSYSIDIHPNKKATREQVQHLVLKLTKIMKVKGNKSDAKGSLRVSWFTPNYLDTSVVLYGYIPPNCKVVKQTRVIPARAEIIEEYESVVCVKGDEEDEDEDENGGGKEKSNEASLPQV